MMSIKKLTFISYSLIATIGYAAAKPFVVGRRGAKITKQNDSTIPCDDSCAIHHPSLATAGRIISSIPRGGDIGPLSAETAAKILVGFTIANGYPMWRATEATAKSWGCDELSEVQKDLFKGHAFNMLSLAIADVALLNGASTRTAIGLWALIASAETLCLIIDGTRVQYDNSILMKGLHIKLLVCGLAALLNIDLRSVVKDLIKGLGVLDLWNSTVEFFVSQGENIVAVLSVLWFLTVNTSQKATNLVLKGWMALMLGVISFAILLNTDWPLGVNDVLAASALLTTAIGFFSPQKVWGTYDDENALTTLAINNWVASNAGIALLLCPLIYLDTVPTTAKMIGYSHVPFTLLSVYNAIFSKAAKEIMVADGVRYFFAVVMTVLVSATLF